MAKSKKTTFGVMLRFVKASGAMTHYHVLEYDPETGNSIGPVEMKPGDEKFVNHYQALQLTVKYPDCFSTDDEINHDEALRIEKEVMQAAEVERMSLANARGGLKVPERVDILERRLTEVIERYDLKIIELENSIGELQQQLAEALVNSDSDEEEESDGDEEDDGDQPR